MPRMGHVFARLNGYGVQLIPYWPIAIVSKSLLKDSVMRPGFAVGAAGNGPGVGS